MATRRDDTPTAAIHAVLVTYRRPEWLARSLAALAAQTRPVASLTVVDNAPDDANRRLVEGADVPFRTTYHASPANIGPAGGLAAGIRRVLATAPDSDWLLLLDDDDPPRREDALARLMAFAERLSAAGIAVGGVGLSGSSLDRATGRLRRLDDEELTGTIRVDHVAGNQLPLYRVGAVRAVGPPEERLFFGFEELEFGLRLVTHGHQIYTDGDIHRSARAAAGRLDLEVRPSRVLTGPPTWRRYYSLRNQLWILRQHGLHRQAVRVAVTQGLLKPAANLPRRPSLALAHLRLNVRAIRDGFTDRLGLTLPPE